MVNFQIPLEFSGKCVTLACTPMSQTLFLPPDGHLLMDSVLRLHLFDSSYFELSVSEKAMPWTSTGLI